MGTPFAVAYHKDALAALRGIDQKRIRQRIIKKIAALADDARPPGCAKMHGVEDGTGEVYRIRSGDYRVIYVIRGAQIVVLDIGNRKDIYR
jgi:mRNA interferase RelE/StbE